MTGQFGCHQSPPRPQFDGTLRWMDKPFIEQQLGELNDQDLYDPFFPDALTSEELESFLAWVRGEIERVHERSSIFIGIDGNYPHTEAMESLFADGFLMALVQAVSESKPEVVLLSIGVWEETDGWRCGIIVEKDNATFRLSTHVWGASRGEVDS